MRGAARRLALLGVLLLGVAGCAGAVGPELDASALEPPRRSWLPEAEPRAAILALHGFNDYSMGFDWFGEYAAEHGIAVHAYDQHSFGYRPSRGIWPGAGALVEDARAEIEALRARYPDRPLFVLGESMGASVLMLLYAEPDAPEVEGLVLSAPAVWGGEHLNPLYRGALRFFATLFPGFLVTATGDAFNVRASDNDEALRMLGADPLVIKRTRLDSVLGIVELMDAAFERVPEVQGRLLVLGGARDEVIPVEAFEAMRARLEAEPCTSVLYPDGWHLLLRDLQREVVYRDILAWIAGAPLPSSHEQPCGEAPRAGVEAARR